LSHCFSNFFFLKKIKKNQQSLVKLQGFAKKLY